MNNRDSRGAAVLVATLGNNDVHWMQDAQWTGGEQVGNARADNPYRANTKKILDQLRSHAKGEGEAPPITLPLIAAAIKFIEGEERELVRVYLLATDQSTEDKPEWHWGDTIHAAEIVKLGLTGASMGGGPLIPGLDAAGVLRAQSRARGNRAFRPLPAKAVQIITCPKNPMREESALDFARDALVRARKDLDRMFPVETPTVYLSTTGGVPALSLSVLLNGVAILPAPSVHLRVEPGAREARDTNLLAELRWQSHAARQRALIEAHDYGSAAKCHLATRAERRDHQRWHRAAALLEHADARLVSDYDRARTALRRHRREAGDDGFLETLFTAMDDAVERDRQGLYLWDMVRACKAAAEAERWFDLISRIYPIVEGSLRSVVKRHVPAMDERMGVGAFIQAIAEPARRDQVKAAWGDIRTVGFPGPHLLTLALPHLGNLSEEEWEALRLNYRLLPAVGLRNRFYHRGGGVSRELVAEALGQEPLNDALAAHNLPEQVLPVEPLLEVDALLAALKEFVSLATGNEPQASSVFAVQQELLNIYDPAGGRI